ncbi:MAG TPA: hypothetical protein P5270_07850 [Victivallales bacterium]|nr:hypothetical protein [Victivallales bacterium]HRR29262.1 hypothetical protein [Victivallales bacterium]
MSKKYHFLTSLLFVFGVCIFFTGKASEISDARVSKINSIISRFKEAGENLNDPDVRMAILKEVSRFYPLEPEAKPNLITREELSKVVREKVQLKFPDNYQDLEKRARQNAEKLFQKAKVNDYVKVTYEKGSKSYTVEGYFFGYGAMEHSVNIGGNIIAIFDLIPEDRAKFDDKFREYQKDQYIKKYIRDYYMRKNDYSLELFKQEKDEITKFNENAGYVLAMGKWMTPKELTNVLLDSLASQGTVASTEPILKENTTSIIDDKTAIATIQEPTPTIKSTDNTNVEENKKKLIAEVRKKAEIDQQRIKTRFAGIDSDQGYGNAIWWMKHADVNLLFDSLVSKTPEGDMEILSFEKGPVEKVELYFFNGYFYKVVVKFRIAPTPKAMEILYRKIVKTYGKTDQEKEEEKANAEAETAANEKTNKEEQKSEEKKEGEQPPEEIEIPQELTLTWTGQETKGSLFIKLTPDKKAYSEFILTKESTKVVQEVTALIEKERKAKTEAELKKLLEEYGEFKIK